MLTIPTFEPFLHQSFSVSDDDAASLELELIEIRAIAIKGRRDPDVRQEPFALYFRGPAAPILSQKTYRLAHSTTKVFDIFIVPIGPDDEGRNLYEAVFN